MPIDDVTDPSDWLSTPLSGLAAVEAALRCQVCKDFFQTPMITSCSHTFCSLCIRRALVNDGKCPLCRSPDQELKLRRNWTVEEAVNCFSRTRPDALALARRKRKAKVEEPSESQPKRLRTSARLTKTRAAVATSASPVESHQDVVIASDDDDDDEYHPDDEKSLLSPATRSQANMVAADGLVPCPSCQKCMKEWQVFQHLESCPGPSTQGESRSNDGISSALGQAQQQRSVKQLERLPALNYSILKENALRKKMTEIGIPSHGPRPLLERRHKEWLTLWNANCDATNPKKRSHLLNDLDVWERTQGSRAPVPGRIVSAAAVKDKDFDTVAWAAKHDSSFKNLIANARRSKLEATTREKANGSVSSTDQQANASLGAPSSSSLSPADAHDAATVPDAAALGSQAPSCPGLDSRPT
ncbi:hypothetical protein XA68_12780 [Ophiocordyceps unilateralis]|uniref:Postreplication repair E3 ubiquitin-protein ligase RAD18 n=1 Tax=Ophiocordyceps unilateralis TaxID=268505 RepID=A0A2A9PD32_OPHUN|nr:hypothetical protein XA68_12780 [Ophiocordyceps unilateralis]